MAAWDSWSREVPGGCGLELCGRSGISHWGLAILPFRFVFPRKLRGGSLMNPVLRHRRGQGYQAEADVGG